MSLSRARGFALTLSIGLSGCGTPAPAEPDPDVWDLVVERGGDQEAPVATLLPQTLLVQVTRSGAVISGALVSVEVAGGGGSIWIPGRTPVFGVGASMTERTGRDGRSEFFLGLGQAVGTYTFDVTVNGEVNGDPAKTVAAFAIAGPPELVTVGGDNQMGSVSMRLVNAISITVTDLFGNPTPQIPVLWNVATGSGSTVDSVTVTDQTGQSTNEWDLGTMAGVQMLEAIVDTLAPIIFTAVAN